jgi:hypothetical protein
MSQLHKRLSDEQIKAFLQSYCQGKLTRNEVQEVLEIGKTRFFYLLKNYRKKSGEVFCKLSTIITSKIAPKNRRRDKKSLTKRKKYR